VRSASIVLAAAAIAAVGALYLGSPVLAGTLGNCNCVDMRGHGMTVIGDDVPEAVFRAIYTEMNARRQLKAT
jgi:ribulose-5-phosphate 4-epimerase/fuculose-1-phosphate aldolase